MSNRQEPQFQDLRERKISPVTRAAAPHAHTTANKPKAKPLAGISGVIVSVMIFGMFVTFILDHMQSNNAPDTQPDSVMAHEDRVLQQAHDDYWQGQAAFKRGDHATAVRHFRACADDGQALCQQAMGYFYGEGLGVRRDDAQAVQWLLKAAKQGNATAMHDLGIMYGDGRGVEQDPVESFLWLSRAEVGGIEAARPDIEFIMQRMVPSQRRAALALWREETDQSQVAR